MHEKHFGNHTTQRPSYWSDVQIPTGIVEQIEKLVSKDIDIQKVIEEKDGNITLNQLIKAKRNEWIIDLINKHLETL
jgi:hypothetical protein